jgi:hypothetical protein
MPITGRLPGIAFQRSVAFGSRRATPGTIWRLDTSCPRVTNNGSVTHSFAVRTPFGVLKSEPIPPGQEGGLTVDLIKPGIYAFYCPLHDYRQKGMQGSVVVQSS